MPSTEVGDHSSENILLLSYTYIYNLQCEKNIFIILPEVGFEPTHPKITELKSAALDHSAMLTYLLFYYYIYYIYILYHMIITIINNQESNPWPLDYNKLIFTCNMYYTHNSIFYSTAKIIRRKTKVRWYPYTCVRIQLKEI